MRQACPKRDVRADRQRAHVDRLVEAQNPGIRQIRVRRTRQQVKRVGPFGIDQRMRWRVLCTATKIHTSAPETLGESNPKVASEQDTRTGTPKAAGQNPRKPLVRARQNM